jgi:hypothetical protein
MEVLQFFVNAKNVIIKTSTICSQDSITRLPFGVACAMFFEIGFMKQMEMVFVSSKSFSPSRKMTQASITVEQSFCGDN